MAHALLPVFIAAALAPAMAGAAAPANQAFEVAAPAASVEWVLRPAVHEILSVALVAVGPSTETAPQTVCASSADCHVGGWIDRGRARIAQITPADGYRAAAPFALFSLAAFAWAAWRRPARAPAAAALRRARRVFGAASGAHAPSRPGR